MRECVCRLVRERERECVCRLVRERKRVCVWVQATEKLQFYLLFVLVAVAEEIFLSGSKFRSQPRMKKKKNCRTNSRNQLCAMIHPFPVLEVRWSSLPQSPQNPIVSICPAPGCRYMNRDNIEFNLSSSLVLCQGPSVGFLTLLVLGDLPVELISHWTFHLSWWTEVMIATKPIDGTWQRIQSAFHACLYHTRGL